MRSLSSKNILLASLGFMFIFLIFSAIRIGTSDLITRYTRSQFDTWAESKTIPDVSELENLTQVLGVARLVAPDNPDHLEDLARINLIHARLIKSNIAERSSLLERGVAFMRSAIFMRPVSADSWATLLLLKNEQGAYDEEFRHALARSVTLGPWEPEVIPVVADVGLSSWVTLPMAEQELVRENFLRGMKRQDEVMIAIAQSHQIDCSGEQAKLKPECTK